MNSNKHNRYHDLHVIYCVEMFQGCVQAPMERFRPNLVVGGKDLAAYAEDGWTALRIGDAGFQVAGVLNEPKIFM